MIRYIKGTLEMIEEDAVVLDQSWDRLSDPCVGGR